ncbi:MAG: hypothetical protein EOP49_51285 [Sphingobacteriales bacterium]|nr:MAG: hypothetical protein EOP49_51285 [Sphingobacteriales bacterium]
MPQLFITYIAPGAILLPIGIAIARSAHWGRSELVVFLYLILSGVTNTIASYFAHYGWNNMPILHAYTLLEFLAIAYFFDSTTDNPKEKLVIAFTRDLLPLITVINIMGLGSVLKYNQIARTAAAIMILLLCIYFLMKGLNLLAAKMPFFSFATVVGFMLYFSGSLTLFALSDLLLSAERSLFWLIWNTHAAFMMVMYLIIALAYFRTRRSDEPLLV